MSANLPILGLHPDRAEAEATAEERAIKAHFDDAVEGMLREAGTELPYHLFCVDGTKTVGADKLIDEATGLPTERVDNIDKWVRVLMLCKLTDADMVLQQFRDWAQAQWAKEAEALGISARALDLASDGRDEGEQREIDHRVEKARAHAHYLAMAAEVA